MCNGTVISDINNDYNNYFIDDNINYIEFDDVKNIYFMDYKNDFLLDYFNFDFDNDNVNNIKIIKNINKNEVDDINNKMNKVNKNRSNFIDLEDIYIDNIKPILNHAENYIKSIGHKQSENYNNFQNVKLLISHFGIYEVNHVVLSLIYLNRFIKYNKEYKDYILLFIFGLHVSMKFIDDNPYNNKVVCDLLNIDISTVNKLEFFYLKNIHFNTNFKVCTYKKLLNIF